MLQPEVDYAGFWIRTGACLIDTFILFVITLPLLWMYYQGDWDLILGTGLSVNESVLWFDLLANYGLPFIYTMMVWMIWSSSPGKILLGLKITDAETGEKLKFGQAVLRYVGYFPAILIFGIGLFWVAFDKRKQGWHDKMAKTVVIRTNE
ncbi:RDD family protein [Acinetobacter tianfuensis]|uniref:RDD family protein n=1 Tax=Acinetobacter tianfuensis TaxID=2419603 RepID=A0A3A8EJN3_9GAMM|nr:RDD family protein [Acinetobacter tianfuensis]RKG30950.1 RDD family protein [Acinetobacter tianfuensis]